MIGENSKIIMLGGGGAQTVTSSRPRCWSCWDFTTPVMGGGGGDIMTGDNCKVITWG